MFDLSFATWPHECLFSILVDATLKGHHSIIRADSKESMLALSPSFTLRSRPSKDYLYRASIGPEASGWLGATAIASSAFLGTGSIGGY